MKIRPRKLRASNVKRVFLFSLALVVCEQLVVVTLFYMGMNTPGPLAVKGATVRHFTENISFRQRQPGARIEKYYNESSVRLAAFDDLSLSENLKLSNTWDLVSSDQGILKEQVDANTCFAGGSIGGVNCNCLPSFLLVGFEKCGTTVLNIWLSYHPNLLANWLEGRFFDSTKTLEELDDQWRMYLRNLPRIPGGQSGIGKYWTYEKSPAYATNPRAPEMMAALVPNARLLFLTRNPTARAYSMFLMYTHHYPSVSNALKGQPVSFFCKNMATGSIFYVREKGLEPGVGGQIVPEGSAPTRDEWRFLSYPPDPKDFDTWVRMAIEKSKKKKLNLEHQGRPNRILLGGLYSEYLKKWLHYFPPEHFVVIPSELFHTSTAADSMESLQTLLGLPAFDYRTITSLDSDSGRTDILSFGTAVNAYVNSYRETKSMLGSTKKLLDEFYCQSNGELSRMLGGRALSGYSCAENEFEASPMA
jgi:hypothetical protein